MTSILWKLNGLQVVWRSFIKAQRASHSDLTHTCVKFHSEIRMSRFSIITNVFERTKADSDQQGVVPRRDISGQTTLSRILLWGMAICVSWERSRQWMHMHYLFSTWYSIQVRHVCVYGYTYVAKQSESTDFKDWSWNYTVSVGWILTCHIHTSVGKQRFL